MLINMPEITREHHHFRLGDPVELKDDGQGVWWRFGDQEPFCEVGLENDFSDIRAVVVDVVGTGIRYSFIGTIHHWRLN